MKLLIPTDFSPLARIALNYAVEMARNLQAELILLHHVNLDVHGHSMAAFKSERIMEAMMENANSDFTRLVSEISGDQSGGPAIRTVILKGGNFDDVVHSYAIENAIDFIIIGSRGASGIAKVVMGSQATALIKRCTTPVITVPEKAVFEGINNLVYSSDLRDIKRELKIITSFVSNFGSKIHIVHVDEKNSWNDETIRQLQDEMIAAHQYPGISIRVYKNASIPAAIEDHIRQTKADLLAMFTHKTTFFESLFGKSVTREMAFHNTIPLLSVKK